VLKQPRLLHVKTDCVGRRLAERTATPQAQARTGIAAPTAKARSAITIGHRDRTKQSKIVQMQNGPTAGPPSRCERTPPKQRVDVMSMDDIGTKSPHGALDCFGIGTSQE
jgi:hypothetical protein